MLNKLKLSHILNVILTISVVIIGYYSIEKRQIKNNEEYEFLDAYQKAKDSSNLSSIKIYFDNVLLTDSNSKDFLILSSEKYIKQDNSNEVLSNYLGTDDTMRMNNCAIPVFFPSKNGKRWELVFGKTKINSSFTETDIEKLCPLSYKYKHMEIFRTGGRRKLPPSKYVYELYNSDTCSNLMSIRFFYEDHDLVKTYLLNKRWEKGK